MDECYIREKNREIISGAEISDNNVSKALGFAKQESEVMMKCGYQRHFHQSEPGIENYKRQKKKMELVNGKINNNRICTKNIFSDIRSNAGRIFKKEDVKDVIN